MKKGISLVALVVTIIVLIILAGVVIIAGVNAPKGGQLAVFYNNVSNVQEAVTIKMLNNMASLENGDVQRDYNKWLGVANGYIQEDANNKRMPTFDKDINGTATIKIDKVIMNDLSITGEEASKYYVSEKGVVYYEGFEYNGNVYYNRNEVSGKGGDNPPAEVVVIPQTTDSTPGVLSGEGTEVSPYMIESIEDLVAFSNAVSDGNAYIGKTIKLTISLNFKDSKSYVDHTTTVYGDINENGITEQLITELTTEKGFLPIGKNDKKTFSGTLEGNNEKIVNLYINRQSTDYIGLIGHCRGGQVKDLALIDCEIRGGGYCGGFIGDAEYGDKTVSVVNCYNTGTVIGKGDTGGIVGFSGSYVNIINSYFSGTTNGAGIVEGIHANISNCYNTGNTGGGGIATTISGNVKIENSYNEGNCNGAGIVTESYGSNIVNCYNTGETKAGGIVGYAGECNVIVNCYNTGVVTGTGYAGGIVGKALDSNRISNSYNIGDVRDDAYAGGIVGKFSNIYDDTELIIDNCYNTGALTGIGNTGGLVGGISETSTGIAQVSNSYYLEPISPYNTLGYGTQMTSTNMKRQEYMTILNNYVINNPTIPNAYNNGGTFDLKQWNLPQGNLNKGYPVFAN